MRKHTIAQVVRKVAQETTGLQYEAQKKLHQELAKKWNTEWGQTLCKKFMENQYTADEFLANLNFEVVPPPNTPPPLSEELNDKPQIAAPIPDRLFHHQKKKEQREKMSFLKKTRNYFSTITKPRRLNFPSWQYWWIPVILVTAGAGWWFWPEISSGTIDIWTSITSVNFNPSTTGTIAVAIGGFWGLVFFSNLINTSDALLRGERGWLEDVWVPIAIPIFRLFLPSLMISLITWAKENVHPNKYDSSLVFGGMMLGVIAGVLLYGLFRAVTVQRVEKIFDPSPFIPAALVILAANIINPKPLPPLNLHAMEVSFWVTMLTIAIFYESYRKPKSALIGVFLGLILTFIQNPQTGIILILVSSITVMGIGITARQKGFDDMAVSEKLKVTNYFSFITIEIAIVVGFFGSYALSLSS